MIVDLLTSGKAALDAQSSTGYAAKLTPTRWVLGDATNFTFNPAATNVVGNVVTSGTAGSMVYLPLSDDEVSVICRVPDTDPSGVIGNLILYMSYLGTEHAFCMVRESSPIIQNVKLARPEHVVGMELNINIGLSLGSIAAKLDLSGLVMEQPTWLSVANDKNLPSPRSTMQNGIVVQEHLLIGGVVPAFNVGNMWWGLPNMVSLGQGDAAIDMRDMAGGTSGDNYKK